MRIFGQISKHSLVGIDGAKLPDSLITIVDEYSVTVSSLTYINRHLYTITNVTQAYQHAHSHENTHTYMLIHTEQKHILTISFLRQISKCIRYVKQFIF